MKKILLATLACAGLCACSDEIDLSSGTSQKVFEGDKAYIAVNISDVGSSSSTRGTDGGFDSSLTGEWESTNAFFYFFDADGVFVSDGEVWQDTYSENNYEDAAGNTYKDSNDNDVTMRTSPTQVILKGLTEKNYPQYVITVLNKPADFDPGELGETPTITDFEALLSKNKWSGGDENSDYGITVDSKYVMSTSSYRRYQYMSSAYTADDINSPYCVTKLQESDFRLEPYDKSTLESMTDAVQIYVERLAAKVSVNLSSDLMTNNKLPVYVVDENGTETQVGEENYYCIEYDATVGGDDNDDDLKISDDEAVDNIFIALEGWELNARAKNSRMVKNIYEQWTNQHETDGGGNYNHYSLGDDFTWNDPDNHRSYWGMSYNYDVDCGYATNSNGNTADKENDPATCVNEYLRYYDLKNPNEFNDNIYKYCAENTNTAVNSYNSNNILKVTTAAPAITSVLLKARIVTLDDGSSPTKATAMTVVRYNGELFTKEAYLDYVVRHLAAQSDDVFQVFKALCWDTEDDSDPDLQYQPLDASFFDLVPLRDFYDTAGEYSSYNSSYSLPSGNLDDYYAVVLKADKIDNILDAEHNYVKDNADPNYTLQSVYDALEAFNSGADAYGYEDGLMYYNIPIEHLNEIDPDADYTGDGVTTAKRLVIKEANYGVVRNHYYKLTINSVNQLGVGIVDEDEVIVPDPERYLDNYYVACDINVLPWKVVDQEVNLGEKSGTGDD